MAIVKPIFISPLSYVFQEIRNVNSNSIYGYEAFLKLDNGMNARDYVNACMMGGTTHQLELDCFYNAIEQFSDLLLPGKLVINSLPNESIDVHESRLISDKNGKDIMSRVVIDILEYPFMNQSTWYEKERFMLRYDIKSSLNAFGEGLFSDYSCLDFFHPDIVTLPYSLVHGINENEQMVAYIRNLISNLKELGFIIRANGIENVIEYQMLVEMGIDLAQGYYIGMPQKPKPPEFIPDGEKGGYQI